MAFELAKTRMEPWLTVGTHTTSGSEKREDRVQIRTLTGPKVKFFSRTGEVLQNPSDPQGPRGSHSKFFQLGSQAHLCHFRGKEEPFPRVSNIIHVLSSWS